MEQEETDCTHQPGSTPSSAQVPPSSSFVTLSPFPPIPSPSSRRRLSSHFTPTRAITSSLRLAWVSLRGRLVNAEEASSANSIGLRLEDGVAWELFSPAQRFLIVAVIGVAVSESKKNGIINQLKKSVELRDQVLSSMQQKLDNLCDQLSNINSQAGTKANASFNNKNVEPPSNDVFGCDKIKFVDCGCWHCDQHQDLLAGLMGNSVVKVSRGDEVLQYKMPFINEVEHEERRMSDLSDWASSVTSAADMQMNVFAIDQDICNLKRECEEKDASIKELAGILQSNNMAGSKRIGELEDIICRKNTTITRLRKDMMVLEQKVVNLTRLRRPSSSSFSISDSSKLPLMVNNVVYDMDSTTSPSSSDSDSSPVNRPQAPAAKIEETPVQSTELGLTKNKKSAPAKTSSSLVGLTEFHIQSRSENPLKEISANQKSIGLPSSRSKQLSAEGDIRKIRRRTQSATKNTSSNKRWV
ncbi:hypothetical protein H0E87_003509 [Populus deltoides]|uniref:Inactive rhomboid protein n=1 Tax=Populus deltoides TaxID=3696 RepID=A0A8T2ZZI0_POPDE|nr:hypothetical protein H0E87_003509 [Populus deltoides]KAH8522887.1 hypothetical protein H0E87_003509 [Populus deltoides]